MKVNYDLLMQEKIASLTERKRLLLHSCCAPCASGCVDKLTPYFDLTFFFYNPNIDGDEEFYKRAEELKRFTGSYLPGSQVIVYPYDPEEFEKMSYGLETEPERGARCLKCYRLRLEKTARTAEENGFDYFATTLTLSPLKDAQVLNRIGMDVQTEKAEYLCSDFKKRGGNVRSGELCRELDLYRQNYCGCAFSKR